MKKWVKIVTIVSSVAFLFSIVSSSLLSLNYNKNNAIVTVGRSKITTKEYSNMYQREIARIEQAIGQNLTKEQIQILKIKQNIMNQLIWHKMLKEFIKKIGLKINKQIAFEQIAKIPYFLDKDGKFNQQNFHDILQANNISEDEYLKIITEDMITSTTIESLMNHQPKKISILDQLFQYKYESRITDIFTIQKIKVDKKYQPNEQEILTFFDKNKKQMQSPEYRKIQYIIIDAFDYPDNKVKITENEIEKEFQINLDSYMNNPKKDIVNIIFNKKDDAEEFMQKIKQTNDFNSALKELNNNAEITKLNDITANDLPTPIGEIVNNTNEGQISSIIESVLGWHIIKVEKSKDIDDTAILQIKQDIRKYLTDKYKVDRVLNIIEDIENRINANEDIENIAKDHDLTFGITSFFTKQDIIKHTNIKDIITKEPKILQTIFSLQLNEHSITNIEDNDKYFIFKINEIIPSKQKNIEEAKDNIITLLQEEHANIQTLQIADKIIKNIEKNQNIENIENVTVKKMIQIYRTDVAKNISPSQQYSESFVKEIFTTNINQVTKPHNHENNIVLAHVKKIEKANKEKIVGENDILTKFQNTVSNLAQEDMYKYMRDNLKVTIHHSPSSIIEQQ